MQEDTGDEEEWSLAKQYEGSHSNSGRCRHPNENCADVDKVELEYEGSESEAPQRSRSQGEWENMWEFDPWELKYLGR